jgi:hypothetical protein
MSVDYSGTCFEPMHGNEKKKITIWSIGYFPFTMGGKVHRPIKTEIEINDNQIFDLGKGKKGYLIISPKGKTYVAESETGAFVGSTIEDVRKDILEGDKKVMNKQIKEAKEQVRMAEKFEPEEFWRFFK